MSLLNALFRFVRATQPSATPISRPAPLQSDLLKSVSGGSGSSDSPRNTW
jgi:hypothetical protein